MISNACDCRAQFDVGEELRMGYFWTAPGQERNITEMHRQKYQVAILQ